MHVYMCLMVYQVQQEGAYYITFPPHNFLHLILHWNKLQIAPILNRIDNFCV